MIPIRMSPGAPTSMLNLHETSSSVESASPGAKTTPPGCQVPAPEQMAGSCASTVAPAPAILGSQQCPQLIRRRTAAGARLIAWHQLRLLAAHALSAVVECSSEKMLTAAAHNRHGGSHRNPDDPIGQARRLAKWRIDAPDECVIGQPGEVTLHRPAPTEIYAAIVHIGSRTAEAILMYRVVPGYPRAACNINLPAAAGGSPITHAITTRASPDESHAHPCRHGHTRVCRSESSAAG